MVFKKRKNVPFKYVKFGVAEHRGNKRSPFLNPDASIQNLINIDKLNLNLECKSCKSEQKIDVIDLLIELNGKTKINEAIKMMDFKCYNCSRNKFLIS